MDALVSENTNELETEAPGRFGSVVVWSKYSNAQRVSSLHLSNGCLNPASRSDKYSFRVHSSLPAARPAADLSQPCHPSGPVVRHPQPRDRKPALARNTLDSARIPRASKLLICGLFQKGRVLAQDGEAALPTLLFPGSAGT